METTCPRCIAALMNPAAYLKIDWQPDDADHWDGIWVKGDITNLPIPKKIELIARARELGRDVYLGHRRIYPPVTTWHGDPICEFHLFEVVQQQVEPRTVRMAQWKPGSEPWRR